MKQKILILSVLFFAAVASTQAQVNIGSADNPTEGAVLDLSHSGNSGLILPYVTLTGTTTYQLGTSVTQALDTYPAGAGTVVYNTGGAGALAAGIYIWDGNNWLAAGGTITPPPPSAQLAYRNSDAGAITGFKSFLTYNLGADPSKSIKEQLAFDSPATSNLTHYADASAAVPFSTVYGSLYQWGRTSDGHQNTWSQNYPNTDSGGDGIGVSEVSLDATTGQVKDTATVYGKFIKQNPTTKNDWIIENTLSSNYTANFHMFAGRWDGGNNSAYIIPASPASPAKVAGNDPCPAGFKVPSRDDWQTIANGVGGGNLSWNSKVALGVNRWVLVVKNDNLTTAIHGASLDGVQAKTGGVLIYPPKSGLSGAPSADADYETDPVLFLPAAGFRNGSSGLLNTGGSSGRYWSSTAYSHASDATYSYAYLLDFGSGNVTPATFSVRATGYSVRCVAE
ncbi:hypothetical protein FACS1894176_00150 [Bacteroidia bacterium]|nr:hypothetical protein FACS1894176_00150 [Bacteroidia bacterium]